MKIVLLFLALLLSFSCHLEAQSYLTPRIGNEIDRVEREYFGLFPEISGFKNAKASALSDQSTLFTITSLVQGRTMDTTIHVSKRFLDYLSKYIDNFESVRMKDNMVNYSVFKNYVGESPAAKELFHEPMETTVELLDGNILTGSLLWAEDSSLVIWKSEAPYNWRTVGQNAGVIRVEKIKELRVERQGGFSTGARYGAYAGIGVFLVVLGYHYDEFHIRDIEDVAGSIFVAAAVSAFGAVVGGIAG